MMRVTTKYKTNAQGRGQIVATGAGRQKTVSYEQERSTQWNHGAAAGMLMARIVPTGSLEKAERTVRHIHLNDKHVFEFEV